MDRRALIATIGAAGLLLAACGGTGESQDQGRRIEIDMRSFAFTPNALTLKPGEKVTLVLNNRDTAEHEFMAGREPMKDGGYKEDLLARLEITPKPPAAHEKGHGGIAVLVQPGRSGTMTFVVPDGGGTFEFGCFLPGHYEGGMKGALAIEATVAPAAPSAVAPAPAATAAPARTATAAPASPAPQQPAATAAPTATGEHAGEGH